MGRQSEPHGHTYKVHGCVLGSLPEVSTPHHMTAWETVWNRSKEYGLQSQAAWAPLPNPLLTGWVTAGKLPNLSVPHWLHL